MDMNLPQLAPAVSQAVGNVVGSATAHLDTTQLFALAAALGWASGLRLYAAVFLTGLAGYLGWVPLPAGLHVLQQPVVMGAAGIMLLVEFLADKIPLVDSLWDTVHTFIRIPAGAALAAGALGGTDAGQWQVIAALMGGALAATSHVAKTTTRAAVNTSPEPFSNIAMSLLGDAAVPGMLWLSVNHPAPFFIVLTVVLVLMVVLTAVLFKFVRGMLRRLQDKFGPAPSQA